MYRRTGKQVLYNDQHFADAVTECAAQLIVDGLNTFDHPLIHPDLAQPERESDYDWEQVVPDDPHSFVVREPRDKSLVDFDGAGEMLKPIEHHVSRQSDEYACSCGARWPVDEGEEHP